MDLRAQPAVGIASAIILSGLGCDMDARNGLLTASGIFLSELGCDMHARGGPVAGTLPRMVISAATLVSSLKITSPTRMRSPSTRRVGRVISLSLTNVRGGRRHLRNVASTNLAMDPALQR